jgi:hypothetical protein
MKSIPAMYEHASDQEINMQKYELSCSMNKSDEMRDVITKHTRCSTGARY